VAKQERRGTTDVINAGALQRARVKTFVIVDADSRQVESVVVPV
jgi:hypothetical protein